ncbi:Prophage minor tail protein Z (GPZ) [Malonomonas rubra DSM 5091]|uniref:Prophage minor tail protein Z (GPZ) n=1 Tax=Malonomonas rubra DSM 5091 TaxID=1122189 RepID=A0A1M6HPG2_MALRU|nr:phage tail protein [Malonomonas rubra]SHJ24060.1 Prophage minor tail protein Z (GPZ) [Malonomonas rubra DSM 5091]
MDLSIKLEGFDRAMMLFDSKKVIKASSHAINDVASRARTAADKQIRSKFALKAGFTKQKVRVSSRANRSALRAILTAQSTPISLKHFPTKQIIDRRGGVTVRSGSRRFDEYRKSSKGARGLSARITQKGGYRPIKHGFSLRHSRGGVSYWRRTGPGRWGTMEGAEMLRVITVASMFKQAAVKESVRRAIRENWPKRFKYRLSKELSRR